MGDVFLVCLSDCAAAPGAGAPLSEHLVFEYMDCLVFNEETGFLYALNMIVYNLNCSYIL